MPPRGRDQRRGGGAGAKAKAKLLSRTMDEFFTSVYADRWPALKRAMLVEAPKIALYNRFCQLPFKEVFPEGVLVRVDAESPTKAFQPVPQQQQQQQQQQDSTADDNHDSCSLLIDKPPLDPFNVRGYYLMDYASALVVEQLRLTQFDKVLDLCAAPGGKSIAIAQFLSQDAELVANERNGERCARLRRNMLDHVPVNFVPWRVTQRDAETWHDPCTYDKVLVDAPCSSERHLLAQGRGASVTARQWTEASSVEIANTQRILLQRALETCKPGGRVVYSTCSISPHENDGVVSEVLRRTRCEVEIVAPSDGSELESAGKSPRLGEPTKHGWILLPDVAAGWGPIFFCVIGKISNMRRQDSTSSSEDEAEEGSDKEQ